jgi:hypothetical protein
MNLPSHEYKTTGSDSFAEFDANMGVMKIQLTPGAVQGAISAIKNNQFPVEVEIATPSATIIVPNAEAVIDKYDITQQELVVRGLVTDGDSKVGLYVTVSKRQAGRKLFDRISKRKEIIEGKVSVSRLPKELL